MKTNRNKHAKSIAAIKWSMLTAMAMATVVVLAGSSLRAKDHEAETRYAQENLVSDQDGIALTQDPDLVNAWGMSFSTGSPFWISDNGTGKSTLYAVTNDASGNAHVAKQGLIVQIPGDGTVSGQAFNTALPAFRTNMFLFVSEDGTISGWRPNLATNAEVLVSRSTAVYKGMTIAAGASGPVLLAANFGENSIDVYDPTLTLLGQFTDADAPDGYAPFNVQNLHGIVFVTYAKQDDAKHDDVAGRGHGLIDIFDPVTGSLTRFATGKAVGGKLKEINSPWGLALAPNTFGEHADQLLVGNFGSGTIMTFDAEGNFQGLLKSTGKGPVKIDGLWALAFGNGARAGVTNTLYFTAGPDGESHGLFGSLTPVEESPKGNGKNH